MFFSMLIEISPFSLHQSVSDIVGHSVEYRAR